MDKPKLLIADSNEDFRLALANALKPFYQVFSCQDGKAAMEILRTENPALLVLDTLLPELDGISLLQIAARENIRPTVMIASGHLSTYVQQMAIQLGVGYLLQKPCDIPSAVDRIRELEKVSERASPDPRTRICQILFSLNFSAKHDGFLYLMDAIAMLAQALNQPVTKIIYPDIAAMYGCTADNVERCIRSALSAAWNHRNEQIWLEYFPNHHSSRPSNADFMIRIALELQMTGSSGMI